MDALTTENKNDDALPRTDAPKANVYTETVGSIDELMAKVPYYSEIMQFFADGIGKIELRKRFMLKAIDEAWVRVIEDTIPCLDTIIRSPGMLLQEEEKILPIELTRKVTGRSVQHLSQHTDFINEIRDDGTVMPSKLLNVYQDETVLTYENKFINTLLANLYGFVIRRYDSAIDCGEDEKNTRLEISSGFLNGETTTKINLTIEVTEPPKNGEVVKNYIYTTDLWKRVERIKKVVSGYMGSDFVRQMGKAYVHPPIMRTNKILKNVDFRQCLALWEFMEQYENTGYETLIAEDLEKVDEKTVKEFYDTMAMQYVLFKRNISNEFIEENVLDSKDAEAILHPEFVDELDPTTAKDLDQSNLVPDGKNEEYISETGEEDLIEDAILVALAADSVYTAEEADGDEESVMKRGEILFRYKHSFLSRLIRSGDKTQDFYTELKNELLSYEKVSSRISWNYEAFNAGRKMCARMNVKGKTVFLYLPLDPAEYTNSKYHATDAAAGKKEKDLACLMKVRSERGCKQAKELIAIVMEQFGFARLENHEYVDYHMPYETPEELAKHDPPLVKIIGKADTDVQPDENEADENELASTQNGETLPAADAVAGAAAMLVMDGGISYKYRYSFTARLIQSGSPLQDFYGELKNYLLSYTGVKSSMAWGYESFRFGRKTLVKMKGRGKTLVLSLALDPANLDAKYRAKELSSKGANALKTQIRVKSARGVKYAKQLIDEIMKELGVTLGELQTVDYSMPYQSNEELMALDKPLVKPVGDGSQTDKEADTADADAEDTADAEDAEDTAETEDAEDTAEAEDAEDTAEAEGADVDAEETNTENENKDSNDEEN